MSKDGLYRLGILSVLVMVIGSCASSDRKMRQQVRDQVSQNARFYCDFINAEKFSDFDVTLNIAMAEKCEGSLPFTVTSFRTPSDIPGLLYCCNMKSKNYDSLKAKPGLAKPVSSVLDSSGTVAPVLDGAEKPAQP